MTRARVWLAAGAALLLAGCAGALGTADRWILLALDPGAFDPVATPPAPDYTDAIAWAALPTTADGADVALPELPASNQEAAPADVFYLHPTTWLGRRWNGPIDDPVVVDATERGGTLIQASVFNACCAVWAPRYRQANGRAFTRPDAAGARAVDLAYGDVSAAFDHFLGQTGDRPFVIAGHSQGAVLGARLVRERIAGTVLEQRLVAAVLPGAPIDRDEAAGLPPCRSESQTGCLVSWHARGPRYQPGPLEFSEALAGPQERWLCVNPLDWEQPERQVRASEHAGAVFFDTAQPAVRPAFADAQCRAGRLVIREHGDLERDLASTVLLWMMGPDSYHPVEYQLFYVDLRTNIGRRVDAWLARRG